MTDYIASPAIIFLTLAGFMYYITRNEERLYYYAVWVFFFGGLLIALTFVMGAYNAAFSQTLSGQISRYRDGDTFVLQGQPIRLCGIDTPEKGTQGYNEAEGFLVALTNGRQVTCRVVGEGTPCDGRSKKRSRDRLVAQCFINGQDIADELVRSSHACDWRKFSGGWYSRNGGCVR